MESTAIFAAGNINQTGNIMNDQNSNRSLAHVERLTLTEEWDKTFPESDRTDHRKVTFVNRYGITLVADMYTPKGVTGPLAAIAISGPFGAVKEQASGLYAQQLAERGFLTIAFDPSFTGESGGMPRRVASPDINTEDFCAAVDFLITQPNVEPSKVGILGICGFGGFALNAAANDTRIKATVASTMYDMCRVTANGYFDQSDNADARYAAKEQLCAATHRGLPVGHLQSRRRCGRPSAGRCAGVCEALLRLLQDTERFPFALRQFNRRLECHVSPAVHQFYPA